MILLFPDGDNAIVVAPGANLSLSTEDVTLMEESLAECKVLLLQLEISTQTAIHAAKRAKDHGVKVILNPAPAQLLPPDVYQYIDVLTPNETEAKILIGRKPNEDISIEELTERLLDLGVGSVVMTQGKEGAIVVGRRGQTRVKAPKVKTVDPTGAGDAFNGALAVALAEGKSLVQAAQWACYGGAHCARKLEVIPGLAKRAQLEAMIKEHTNE
jgi:ribokinase